MITFAVNHTPAERRRVTVLTCDIADSTELIERTPEDEYSVLLARIHHRIEDIAREFGGTVVEDLGDGALLYFGYPKTRESDARQAVAAGLRLVEVFSGKADAVHPHVSMRVGLATGAAVIGMQKIDGRDVFRRADGILPTLAVRLQEIAQPGQVIVSETTRFLTGRHFRYRDLGRLPLKGFRNQVLAWQALDATPALEVEQAGRTFAMRSPLVGRARILHDLQAHWDQARAGNARVIQLTGEAGVGKTRLQRELRALIKDEPHHVILYQAEQNREQMPLHPYIAQLTRTAGISPDLSNDAALERLDAVLLRDDTHHAEDLALIADLLSINSTARVPLPEYSQPKRKEKTFEALLRQLLLLARTQPVLAVFEDAHWSDPTSREWLTWVVPHIAHARIMVLITSREHVTLDWASADHCTEYLVAPLSTAESSELAGFVARLAQLDESDVPIIVRMTDGNPFYIEEYARKIAFDRVKSAQRKREQHRDRAYEMPDGVMGVLHEQLDQLGDSVKEIAQWAALIGRHFTLQRLETVSGKTPAELARATDELIAANHLKPSSRAGDEFYSFRHALMQEAAYYMIPLTKRVTGHRRVLEVLRAADSELVDTPPAELARHAEGGELYMEAMRLWLAAGVQALTRYAMLEAGALLQRGLRLVDRVPDDAERMQLELALQLTLGKALISTIGYAAPATGAAFERARALCEALGSPPTMQAVIHGQWIHDLVRGEVHSAKQRAHSILERGLQTQDALWSVLGYRLAGVTAFTAGEFVYGEDMLQKGLQCFDPARRPAYATVTVGDHKVVMLAYLSYCQYFRGDAERAVANIETALEEARELAQPYSMAQALMGHIYLHALLEDWPQVDRGLIELVPMAREHGIRYYVAMASIFRGLWQTGTDPGATGLDQFTSGLAAYRATQSVLFLPSFLAWTARAQIRAKQIDAALDTLAQAEEIIARSGMRQDAAEGLLVHGEAMQARGDLVAAERDYHAADSLAAEQGARWTQLRAAHALALLWRQDGRSAAAKALLKSKLEAMCSGPICPHYRRAVALLTCL